MQYLWYDYIHMLHSIRNLPYSRFSLYIYNIIKHVIRSFYTNTKSYQNHSTRILQPETHTELSRAPKNHISTKTLYKENRKQQGKYHMRFHPTHKHPFSISRSLYPILFLTIYRSMLRLCSRSLPPTPLSLLSEKPYRRASNTREPCNKVKATHRPKSPSGIQLRTNNHSTTTPKSPPILSNAYTAMG